jgi:hypothetical protein
LKDNQTRLETAMLERLVEWVPAGTKLTVLAARGLGKSELTECCSVLGIDQVIRFRQDFLVTDVKGNRTAAVEHLLTNGAPRMVKTNTSAKRTLFLLNQGCCWYRALPNMPDDRARTLLSAFTNLMSQHESFGAIFAAL